jgi:hypothetical protein
LIQWTNEDCWSSAAQYHAATDEKARQAFFDGSGVRWSELLHLPHFDMSRCIVVDAMHNLFLGLIKEYFDGILGIRLLKAEEVPVITIKFSMSLEEFLPLEQKSISKLEKWLLGPMATDLVANHQ